MSSYLKIGDRLLDGGQVLSALVRYNLLETLIGQILLDAVLQGIPLARQDVYYALGGRGEAPTPEEFDGFLHHWCTSKGVSFDYLQAVVLRDMQIQKFKQLQFADQVESEFLRCKADLDQVAYSLIRVADLALAQELYFQLRDDGTSFVDLAQQCSLGNERHTGGRVGPVPLASLPAAVAALLQTNQVGVIYGPLAVAEEFWVVRLEQLMTACLTEVTRAQILDRLYRQWLQAQTRQIMQTPGTVAFQEAIPA